MGRHVRVGAGTGGGLVGVLPCVKGGSSGLVLADWHLEEEYEMVSSGGLPVTGCSPIHEFSEEVGWKCRSV